MTVSVKRLVVLCVLCCALCGCTWQHQRQINKVVDAYCEAEVRGDMVGKTIHLTPESMKVIGSTSPGGAVPGAVTNPLAGWRLSSYEFTPDRISIKGEKAYATVAGTLVGPGGEKKDLTFTVYLKRYKEPKREGGTETVWRIDEIQTKHGLIEAVIGKGYGDLWLRQLEAQEAWHKATVPRPRRPSTGSR